VLHVELVVLVQLLVVFVNSSKVVLALLEILIAVAGEAFSDGSVLAFMCAFVPEMLVKSSRLAGGLVNLLCQVITSRECLWAVRAGIGTFLGVRAHVSLEVL
jgi:hypothetical protein